jgi:hypothetical protein
VSAAVGATAEGLLFPLYSSPPYAVDSLDARRGKNFSKLVRNGFHASHRLSGAGLSLLKICETALRAYPTDGRLPAPWYLRLMPRFRRQKFGAVVRDDANCTCFASAYH